MARRKASHLTSPLTGEYKPIEVTQLLLDAENPRLAAVETEPTQASLLKTLWSEMAVEEIALSVAHNGFFSHEPLLVIPARRKQDIGKFVVMEGNRRLAAVMLLRDERLREAVGATDLPVPGAENLKRLETLPCLVYPDRESVWAYTGFRHVHGVKPWDSYSKARYVATISETYGYTLEQIAERIGDRHATVERLYRGLKVLEQAEGQGIFSREDRVRARFAFSHLYTALSDPKFRDFVGIDGLLATKVNPVPKRKYADLQELLVWLYGSRTRGIEPVVRKQQPDLWRLQVVISKPRALAALRSGYSLDVAYEIGLGDVKRFHDSLVAAKEELQRARGASIAYRGEEEAFQLVLAILELATALKEELAKKRSELEGRK